MLAQFGGMLPTAASGILHRVSTLKFLMWRAFYFGDLIYIGIHTHDLRWSVDNQPFIEHPLQHSYATMLQISLELTGMMIAKSTV